jgi:hypothetical protein
LKLVKNCVYLSMACNECKKKKEERIKAEKQLDIVENWVILFMVIWSALAVYGLISLIGKFL